jgi:hypothetical protein
MPERYSNYFGHGTGVIEMALGDLYETFGKTPLHLLCVDVMYYEDTYE